jgi:REP element-mobilizing transposase RayT
MVRGIERQTIFRNDADRNDFVARLAKLVPRDGLVVYAWVLLPNHAHLLIRTGAVSLSRSMRSLLTGYAGAFNRRHRRTGHLFQNRYKSIVVDEEVYLLELVRYLHLNPVRAGVVRDLKDLDRYAWSGHATLLGRLPRPWQATAEILGRFSGDPRRARTAYRDFVEAAASQGRRPELQGGGLIRSLGGWQVVRGLRRSRTGEPMAADARVLGTGPFVEKLLGETTHQLAARADHRPRDLDLDTLTQRVAQDLKVCPASIGHRVRMRQVAKARQIVAFLWVEHVGRPASELARAWGLSRSNASWAARRGAEVIGEWRGRIHEWCK